MADGLRAAEPVSPSLGKAVAMSGHASPGPGPGRKQMACLERQLKGIEEIVYKGVGRVQGTTRD